VTSATTIQLTVANPAPTHNRITSQITGVTHVLVRPLLNDALAL
jgi:hypothetical protein